MSARKNPHPARLRYYATRFPVVAVDAIYYVLPREQAIEALGRYLD